MNGRTKKFMTRWNSTIEEKMEYNEEYAVYYANGDLIHHFVKDVQKMFWKNLGECKKNCNDYDTLYDPIAENAIKFSDDQGRKLLKDITFWKNNPTYG